MPVSPELQRGIIDLIYFTWLHNAEMLAYFAGFILTLGLLLKNPKRIYVLFLIGFILLMLQFQYVKHIVEPLLDQTMQTVLQTGAQATRFQKITKFFLEKLIPISLYLAGWGSIFLAIFLTNKNNKTSPTSFSHSSHHHPE